MASSSPSSSSGPRNVEPSSSSSVPFTVEPSSSSSYPCIPELAEKFAIAAVAFFNVDPPDRWQKMADATGGGMTAEEAKMRYELIVEKMENLRKAKFPSETIKDEENEDSLSTEQ